jgi:hypothetical protein
MDCCFSGTTITRGQARTVNEILAASTRESPSYSGSRAYSKLLRNKFATISVPCSVQQIHDDMLSASRLKPAIKTDNALLATPDHGWAGNSLRRSIRLKPLPNPNTKSPVASEDLSRVRYTVHGYCTGIPHSEQCRNNSEALLAYFFASATPCVNTTSPNLEHWLTMLFCL